MKNTEQIISEYICIELLEDPEFELAPSDQILLDDIVDSLGVMRLVDFIEQRGSVSVPAEDVTLENFATVEIIAAYINRRNITFA